MSIEDLSADFDDAQAGDPPLATRDIIREAVERQRSETEPKAADPVFGTAERTTATERGKRDGKGRFAAHDKVAATGPALEVPASAASETAASETAAREPGRAEATEPAISAPETYSATARIAFAHAPAALREAIARREAEIDAGLRKYAGMDPYIRMAEDRGTSLTGALAQYTQIEDVLRKDPVEGIQRIAANLNISPVALAHALLSRSQGGAANPAPPGSAKQPVDEQTVTTRVLQAIASRDAATARQREVAAFGADPENRFYKDVRATMASLIQIGAASTMKEAYDKACWAQPDVRAQLIKGQSGSTQQRAAAAIQARSAAKAVVGPPGPGLRHSPVAPHETTLDTVRRAVQNARGAV